MRRASFYLGDPQQFQIRELYGSKALPSKGLTFLKETSDRWNGAKSFRICNCWLSTAQNLNSYTNYLHDDYSKGFSTKNWRKLVESHQVSQACGKCTFRTPITSRFHEQPFTSSIDPLSERGRWPLWITTFHRSWTAPLFRSESSRTRSSGWADIRPKKCNMRLQLPSCRGFRK